jgi:hypothetical protein
MVSEAGVGLVGLFEETFRSLVAVDDSVDAIDDFPNSVDNGIEAELAWLKIKPFDDSELEESRDTVTTRDVVPAISSEFVDSLFVQRVEVACSCGR